MRRLFRFLPPLILLLLACKALQPVPASPSPAPALGSPGATVSASATVLPASPSIVAPPSPVPLATLFPSPSSQPTGQPTSPPASPPASLSASDSFTVRFHPDGPLYVGDQVSFEVLSNRGTDISGLQVQVNMPFAAGPKSLTASFGVYGIGARQQATLLWAWDTRDLPASDYTLQFSAQPGGPSWVETVHLLPRSQLPPPEPQATWSMATSQCCKVYYITGTEAEVDLPGLLALLDEQARLASQSMGVELSDPIPVVLLPRVLGHGGFASKEIAVSHLARNYMGGDHATIFHHEMIHLLDARLGGDLRPSALIEGLAVYWSGGHFKPEPLMERAAALLPPEAGCVAWTPNEKNAYPGALGCGVDRYIPLPRLFDHFYFEQHEIGYLEAGALIDFMIDTWGWKGFSAFYRDIHQLTPSQATAQGGPALDGEKQNDTMSRSVDAALRNHFGITLGQLEGRFVDALHGERASPANAEDIRLTVRFYDTARRYQQALDPSAHFLTAWLLDNEQMRQRGIVADYLRHPDQPENLALETMLASSNQHLRDGDFASAESLLDAANLVLDAYPTQKSGAFSLHPLAADYLDLVESALAAGYQPQRIELQANGTAHMWVTTHGPQLIELSFVRNPAGWALY